jgi:hypothetical protein
MITSFKKLLLKSVTLFSILIISQSTAIASAGYYPLKIGEILMAEVCVPNKTKLPIYLELNDYKNSVFRVVKINSFSGSRGNCRINENRITVRWNANRLGEYMLSFYSTKSKKRFYGWPDGVEIAK